MRKQRYTLTPAETHFQQGDAYSEKKLFAEAIREYEQALELAPDFAAAVNNLGNAYYRQGKYSESLACYDRACQLCPDEGFVSANLGNAYSSLGRLEEAVDAYTHAIRLSPEDGSGYFGRGHVLSRLGQQQQARVDYQQAIALSPQDSNILWTVTWSLFDPEAPLSLEVVQDLHRIAHVNPSHYTSHCCLAVVAFHYADFHTAQEHLERALQDGKDEWDPHFWLGMVAAARGEEELARQAIDHALELELPPLFLMPLYWMQWINRSFFDRYAYDLLRRFEL